MPSMDNGYWKKLGKKVGPKSEPLSLLYIATYLNKNGHECEVLDCEALGIPVEDLEHKIREGKYDAVGVVLLTMMYSQAQAVCKLVKEVSPKTLTVVGGTHATLRPKMSAEDPHFDMVAKGEAEVTFIEIVEWLEGLRKKVDIKGVAYKEDGEVVFQEEREKIKDLDYFPMPDRGLIDMRQYRPSVSYHKRLPAYTMITTRGCPYRCTFCATAQSGYRMHSVERVIEEMKILVEVYGAKEILLRDDTFTLKRDRTLELCEAIIKEGLHEKMIWDCITRANLVDEELLKKMKEAGCWGIHFGVEGGTQKLMDAVQKDTTLEIVRDAFKWCKELGIETRGYFMVGMPGSKTEDDEVTIAFAKELNPDWAQFTIATPYPGTKLFDEAEKWGKFHTDKNDWDKYLTWSGYSEMELAWTAHGRTSQEIKDLQKRAMREFYFRPKIIFEKLTDVENIPILKKYVVGALALR